MPAPQEIAIHFAEETPPIVCRSVEEMDAALDRLHAEHLRSAAPPYPPLAVAIVIPGYEIDTGLGADVSFVHVQVEPFDGEYYLAEADGPVADGESRMFYGAGQDSYWEAKNLITLSAARDAVRYFVEHQQRSPSLQWREV